MQVSGDKRQAVTAKVYGVLFVTKWREIEYWRKFSPYLVYAVATLCRTVMIL